VLTGLVIYLVMLAASVLAWRKPPSAPAPPTPPAPVSSPIDALLARADAVLRSTNSQISSYVLGRPGPAQTAEPADGLKPSAG
jgi:hypothetical protein